MECTLCKQQYAGKAETLFNITLNNHRNDQKNPHAKTILAFKHFQEKMITLINMQNSLL